MPLEGLHYASDDGERSDELPLAEIRRLVADGTITDETLCAALRSLAAPNSAQPAAAAAQGLGRLHGRVDAAQ